LKYAIKNKRFIFVSITNDEKYAILKYFPLARVISLPNPIPFEQNQNKFYFKKKKIFVYFGRIHPHKNLEKIIYLFKKSRLSKECYLFIYGIHDDQEYLLKLKRLIDLNKNIKIFKPVFGNNKTKIMRSAWVNILLSKSEVLSFSLLESGLNGLPTLVDENISLPQNDSVTIKVRPDEISVVSKLKEISNWSRTQRESYFKKSVIFFAF
jgi:glycosyltransferase involved in cell wall biosynthesis